MTNSVRLGLLASSVAVILSCRSVTGLDVVPLCAAPAPLLGKFDPEAPGYIVVFHPGVDPAVETARLAARYGFQPTYVYGAALRGFAAALSPTVVAAVRCEASVSYAEHDAIATIAG